MVRAATRWDVRDAQARRGDGRHPTPRRERRQRTVQPGRHDVPARPREASGLVRIGPMLQLLGQQVRMFIAVVGITYAFPIEPIVLRNRALLAAIDEGDDELAAQCWRDKMDEALAYMLEQVEAVRIARRDVEQQGGNALIGATRRRP
jgi:hypothetical protein